MTDRDRELLAFYQQHRIEDQLTFYRGRHREFDRATNQALAISAALFGFSSAVGALAGVDTDWKGLWATLAVILPALSASLSAFTAVYAFEQQSKIYGDAVRAVHAASRRGPDTGTGDGDSPADASVVDIVQRVEAALRQEGAQWGQLTTQIQIPDKAKE